MGKAEMVVFDQLPHKLPTREIISLYTSSDPWADFVEIMTRTDASLSAYMNDLRRQRNRRSWFGRSKWGIDGSAGHHCILPGCFDCGAAKKRGRLAKGNQEGRAGPSRTTSEPTLLTVDMEVAAHLQVELTAKDNEVFPPFPQLSRWWKPWSYKAERS
ncbi:hypothetical protein ACSQ67_014517 [Phaseolus vulgaris]